MGNYQRVGGVGWNPGVDGLNRIVTWLIVGALGLIVLFAMAMGGLTYFVLTGTYAPIQGDVFQVDTLENRQISISRNVCNNGNTRLIESVTLFAERVPLNKDEQPVRLTAIPESRTLYPDCQRTFFNLSLPAGVDRGQWRVIGIGFVISEGRFQAFDMESVPFTVQ